MLFPLFNHRCCLFLLSPAPLFFTSHQTTFPKTSLHVQGRLLYWDPESVQAKKALPASYPGLIARFAKETSLHKREMYPDIDHMDVMARQETITNVRGEPVLLQLPVVPSYALTVHKTQASENKIKRGDVEYDRDTEKCIYVH